MTSTQKVLDTNELLFEEKDLFVPPVDEVIDVLTTGLKTNFTNVTVEYVDCPNLKSSPFHLAATGLNGHPTLFEVGGAPYLLPLVDRTKLYDIKELCDRVYKDVEGDEYLAVGAGAGPWPLINSNCEGIYNFSVSGGRVQSESHLAKVDADLQCQLQKIPDTETRIAVLGNIFLSEGKPGKVRGFFQSFDYVTQIVNYL